MNLLSKCSSELESSHTVTDYSSGQHRLEDEDEDRDEHARATTNYDTVPDRQTFISAWRIEVDRESQNDASGNDATIYATPEFAEVASPLDDDYQAQE